MSKTVHYGGYMKYYLKRFNLKKARYIVTVVANSNKAFLEDNWIVVIYNPKDKITLKLSTTLTFDVASLLKNRIETANVVDLEGWEVIPGYLDTLQDEAHCKAEYEPQEINLWELECA
jgi:hypothetical protein